MALLFVVYLSLHSKDTNLRSKPFKLVNAVCIQCCTGFKLFLSVFVKSHDMNPTIWTLSYIGSLIHYISSGAKTNVLICQFKFLWFGKVTLLTSTCANIDAYACFFLWSTYLFQWCKLVYLLLNSDSHVWKCNTLDWNLKK